VEFVNINFNREWPLIIQDLAHYLSGVELLKSNQIAEQEELNQTNLPVEMCKESELVPYKQKASYAFFLALNAFRALEGKEKRITSQHDIEIYMHQA
jgi:hypothetical protein